MDLIFKEGTKVLLDMIAQVAQLHSCQLKCIIKYSNREWTFQN